MQYYTTYKSPAFKQAQTNALRASAEKVHDALVQQFGLPDDHDTHLMVSEMLKALVTGTTN